MLFLPAAALCCLCSALVAMAAELIQDQLSLTRRVGDTVSFSCGGTDQCGKQQVYWYQKTETDPHRVILHVDMSDGTVNSRYSHPQKDDFSASRKTDGCELKIEKVQLSHSASYYCCCQKKVSHMILVHDVDSWTSADTFSSRQVFVSVSFTVGAANETNRYLIFGSGTKLYVTDEAVVKPVVSVCPAAPRAHPEGKSSLLCLASAMSPPLVQFSWKRQKEDGSLEELKPDDGEQLVLTEPGRTAAILLIHQPENSTYKYRCYVEHEGGTVEAQTQQVMVARAPAPPPPPASVQHWFRERLLCLLYTGLIVKSLVYCCGLSVIRIFRNKGPSTHSRRAD
ncbi:immunoglobulin lambda-1 light chain-like [Seriola aureovittata]|uniref:immunoglobulin lambda-1 light chain-like n=1 Tax=Seriola aureovittata TaxID=2871759 RepID=UPI0024BDB18B|nr:immunoglobulin lambda-1 light chain-like [Seriola aureovittata]